MARGRRAPGGVGGAALRHGRRRGRLGEGSGGGEPRKWTGWTKWTKAAACEERWVHSVHKEYIQSIYAALSANAALVLIGVACALLDRQINPLAAAFTEEGGFTERLYRVRSQHRRHDPP